MVSQSSNSFSQMMCSHPTVLKDSVTAHLFCQMKPTSVPKWNAPSAHSSKSLVFHQTRQHLFSSSLKVPEWLRLSPCWSSWQLLQVIHRDLYLYCMAQEMMAYQWCARSSWWTSLTTVKRIIRCTWRAAETLMAKMIRQQMSANIKGMFKTWLKKMNKLNKEFCC